MPNHVQGYDPGTSGASTLLDGAGVVCVWAWKDCIRGGERSFQVVRVIQNKDGAWVGTKTMAPTLNAVGVVIARESMRITGRSRWDISCEAAHFSKSIKTAIRLGEITGELTGPVLRFATGRKIRQVQATVWRHLLLQLPIRTKRDVAKAASLKFMPLRLRGLQECLDEISRILKTPQEKLDHVTDSAGVAEWLQRSLPGARNDLAWKPDDPSNPTR